MLGPLLSPHRIALAAGCSVLWASCTPFEPGSDELTAETPSLSAATSTGGADWSCLNLPRPEAAVVSPRAPQLLQSLQVLSSATNLVPPNVSVRACAQRDPECLAPLTPATPIDAEGWVDLTLYEGFDGYLEITADTLVPTMLFYADPLDADRSVDTVPVGVVENAVLPSLAQAIGTSQSPELGLVYLRAFDCQGVAAPGVTFSIDRAGSAFYFVGGLPSATASETSAFGLGGFVNVGPGVVVVDAELPALGRSLASAKSLLVRKGWMTGIRFIPRH